MSIALWLIAVILVALEFGFGWISETAALDPVLDVAISLAIALIVGWLGNDFVRARCEREGLAFAGVAMGETADDAVHRFFVESVPGEVRA